MHTTCSPEVLLPPRCPPEPPDDDMKLSSAARDTAGIGASSDARGPGAPADCPGPVTGSDRRARPVSIPPGHSHDRFGRDVRLLCDMTLLRGVGFAGVVPASSCLGASAGSGASAATRAWAFRGWGAAAGARFAAHAPCGGRRGSLYRRQTCCQSKRIVAGWCGVGMKWSAPHARARSTVTAVVDSDAVRMIAARGCDCL